MVPFGSPSPPLWRCVKDKELRHTSATATYSIYSIFRFYFVPFQQLIFLVLDRLAIVFSQISDLTWIGWNLLNHLLFQLDASFFHFFPHRSRIHSNFFSILNTNPASNKSRTHLSQEEHNIYPTLPLTRPPLLLFPLISNFTLLADRFCIQANYTFSVTLLRKH